MRKATVATPMPGRTNLLLKETENSNFLYNQTYQLIIMQKFPDNPDIAHLGFNFWKKIVDQNPSPYSKNTLLLCLDEDGTVLLRILLPCSWSEVRQHAAQARLLGASTLVRMQESGDPPDIDPFQINSPFTKSLYRAAKIYGLQLTEVIRPCSHSYTSN